MDEAIRRLDNICNEKISLETREAFKATRNHRNKLVHLLILVMLNRPDKILNEFLQKFVELSLS